MKMTADFVYYRCPILLTETRKMTNVLVIENLADDLQYLAIRVNGYLLDFIFIMPGDTGYFELGEVSPDHEVTCHPVLETVNMMLPENATRQQMDFFKNLAVDDVVDWRYDDGTLEADKVTLAECPLPDELLYG